MKTLIACVCVAFIGCGQTNVDLEDTSTSSALTTTRLTLDPLIRVQGGETACWRDGSRTRCASADKRAPVRRGQPLTPGKPLSFCYQSGATLSGCANVEPMIECAGTFCVCTGYEDCASMISIACESPAECHLVDGGIQCTCDSY